MRGAWWNKANGDAFSDVRLIWDGASFLPREAHTVIWWYRPFQQTGYYAMAWHSPNGGPGSWDSGVYSWGTHPYSASDGAVDAFGVSSNPTSSTGTVHWWENAGTGVARDYLCPAGGAGGVQVFKDRWYRQIRKCRLMTTGPNSGLYEHTYIPDFYGNPTFKIVTYGTIGTAGATPAFYLGGSDWEQDALGVGTNDETLSGIYASPQLYNDYLNDADHAIEAGNSVINAAISSAGQTALWYINQEMTPLDIADKKPTGTAHPPRWANANRPIPFILDQKLNMKTFPISRMRR